MRLDLFLKSSRLCARRTVAQKLCEAGLVSVNDNPAKSSTTVKPGDELLMRRRDRVTTVRILSLPAAHQTSRSEAGTLYQVLSEDAVAADDLECRISSGVRGRVSTETISLRLGRFLRGKPMAYRSALFL